MIRSGDDDKRRVKIVQGGPFRFKDDVTKAELTERQKARERLMRLLKHSALFIFIRVRYETVTKVVNQVIHADPIKLTGANKVLERGPCAGNPAGHQWKAGTGAGALAFGAWECPACGKVVV